jgi:poly(3-hydroxyalkanoate) synthetase
MDSYLAWSGGIAKWDDSLDIPPRDKLRAKLVSGLVTDALALINALLTNPTAMKATLDQGGKSLVEGFQHFVQDYVQHRIEMTATHAKEFADLARARSEDAIAPIAALLKQDKAA